MGSPPIQQRYVSCRPTPFASLDRYELLHPESHSHVAAQKFLSSLDDNPMVGRLIDQTMDFEYEQAQMLQKTGEELTPEMWLMK